LREWVAPAGQRQRSNALIANVLGISGPAVSAWLRGVARPEHYHRVALQVLTGIRVETWDTAAERALLTAALKRIDQRNAQPKNGTDG
jgi:predicted transcriptional regulator